MLDQMRVFAKVVHYRNMSLAAKEMGLSTASVSRQVASLEQKIGAQLLDRSSRKLTLTEAGERFLIKSRLIIESMEQLQDELSNLNAVPEGLLRVHAHPSVAARMIMPRLPLFFRAFPGLKLDLQVSERKVDLIEDGYDIDIRLGELKDSSLKVRKLADSERVIVASPAYLRKYGTPRQPADLLNHNCFTYRPNSEITVWKFFRNGQKCEELRLAGQFHSNNSEIIKSLTMQGLGISLQTNWGTAHERSDGQLVQILSDYSVTINSFNNGVFAVFKNTKFMPKKIRLFLDFFSDAEGKGGDRLSSEYVTKK